MTLPPLRKEVGGGGGEQQLSQVLIFIVQPYTWIFFNRNVEDVFTEGNSAGVRFCEPCVKLQGVKLSQAEKERKGNSLYGLKTN